MTTKEQWSQALESLPRPLRQEDADALVAAMQTASKAAGHATAELLSVPHERNSAQFLLQELNASGIEALLETPLSFDAASRAWLARHLVDVELQLRARVAQKLRQLLNDKEQLPPPSPDFQLEVTPPERRVCDEAYVL